MKTLKFWITNLRARLISLFRTKKKDYVVVTVPILKAGVMNANNRIYDQDCVNNINKQLQVQIKNNAAFGHIGGYDNLTDNVVNLAKISHIVVDSNVHGDTLIATIKTTPTPQGKILCEILNKNRQEIVFRPRGFGDLSPANRVINYTLVSVDAIPSMNDSFSGIL